MNKPHNNFDNLSIEDMCEVLQVIMDMQNLSEGKQGYSKVLEKHIPLIMALFEKLANKKDLNDMDQKILVFLKKILGISSEIEEEKELTSEEEIEEEKEMDEKEKEHQMRLVFYEMYKLLNPNRLAGETGLENFLNNVRTRGIKEALKYDGAQYAKEFSKASLEDLESYKFNIADSLKGRGAKGGGRGL